MPYQHARHLIIDYVWKVSTEVKISFLTLSRWIILLSISEMKSTSSTSALSSKHELKYLSIPGKAFFFFDSTFYHLTLKCSMLLIWYTVAVKGEQSVWNSKWEGSGKRISPPLPNTHTHFTAISFQYLEKKNLQTWSCTTETVVIPMYSKMPKLI